VICSALALAAASALAAAQTALATAAEGRAAPGGAVVIALRAGTRVAVGASRGGDVLVTLEGWVDTSRLAGKLDTFPASVDAKASLRMRGAPAATGEILAELRPRAGVTTFGKSGTWAHVRRSAWVPANALRRGATGAAAPRGANGPSASPAAKPPSSAAGSGASADSGAAQPVAPPAAGAMSVSAAARLLAAPVGRALGELAAGTIVQPIEHDHGWAKVRVEGWIPERELAPADSAAGSQLSAADLRADPEGTRGKMVQWEVEVLSLQTADPLRPDLARDEPYLLANGPGTEDALLYLAIPPTLLNQAKALAPLTRVLITARVRVGRSEPVGTPILDLKSISKR
jgi:hypothetical protein